MTPRNVHNPSGYFSSGRTYQEKAQNFALFIKKHGWSGKWWHDKDTDIVHLVATRLESEKIEIEWPPEPIQSVYYTYGDISIKCRNVSAAAKLAQEKPDMAKMRRLAGKGTKRKLNGISEALVSEAGNNGSSADDLIASLATTLPFDKESSPEEIMMVLRAARSPNIAWVNRLTGNVEQDMMKTWSRWLKVTKNKAGKVIIHFVGHDRFHAVYADSVIGIG